MALTILVKGDRYPLPENLTFTYRELGAIRRIAGVEAGEIQGALEKGNVAIIAAFAFIAMSRAGKHITEAQVLDMNIDEIDIAEEVEAEPDPPLQLASA